MNISGFEKSTEEIPQSSDKVTDWSTAHDAADANENVYAAGMIIIATNSPEIRALNLPPTPTFPTSFDFAKKLDFGSCFSPDNSATATSRRNTISAEQNQGRVVTPEVPNSSLSRAHSFKIHVSGSLEDRYPSGSNVISPPSKRLGKPKNSFIKEKLEVESENLKHQLQNLDGNKRNIHPNWMSKSMPPSSIVLDEDDDDSNYRKRTSQTRHHRQRSSHRRASYSSLPLPEEIISYSMISPMSNDNFDILQLDESQRSTPQASNTRYNMPHSISNRHHDMIDCETRKLDDSRACVTYR